MLTSRFVLKRSAPSLRVGTTPRQSIRFINTRVPATASNQITDKPLEEPPSTVTETVKKMRKDNPYLVSGPTGEDYLPASILPDDPSELTFLDPADLYNTASRYRMDGTERVVHIRQETKSARQSPINGEYHWHIKLSEDGVGAEKWTNSLMGWTSSADPYQSDVPLKFNNAAEAVYFAKKRGRKYVVHEPIMRVLGENETQYQDNFLSQATAAKVKAEGVNCREWERSAAGASHYFRPLKYHGDGTVRQHGPSREMEIANKVDGYYKKR